MGTSETKHQGTSSRRLCILTFVLVTLVLTPAVAKAQTMTQPVAYAITELNLRKGPSLNDAVLAFVPKGAEVRRGSGQVTNEYAPVTYNGLTGWVVALGLVATRELADTAETVSTPVPVLAPAPESPPSSTTSSNDRVTLEPLMLRSGPTADAEVLAGMPEGSIVTLTREGAENGYVTVDYGGLRGWAFADLLGEDLVSA